MSSDLGSDHAGESLGGGGVPGQGPGGDDQGGVHLLLRGVRLKGGQGGLGLRGGPGHVAGGGGGEGHPGVAGGRGDQGGGGLRLLPLRLLVGGELGDGDVAGA